MSVIVLDLETPFSPSYSLTKMNYDEYIFDDRFKIFGMGYQTDDMAVPDFLEGDELSEFLQQFPWQDYTVVAHNTYFDGAVLAWKHNVRPKEWLDTMLMYSLLHHGKSASLDAVCIDLWPNDERIRKGHELESAKGYLDAWPEEIREALIGYCLNDVSLTKLIYDKLIDQIPEIERFTIDDTLRKFFYPVLELDKTTLEEALQADKETKETALELLGLPAIELRSNDRFAALLQSMGVSPPTKISLTTGKTTWAFSKNDLGFQALQTHRDPAVRQLVEARLLVKSTQVGSRAETLIRAHDCHNGLCPIPLKVYAAHTLRFGGMDKRNFQNFPREGNLRQAICAPDGHVLYVVDWAAIEARMLAYLAEHLELIQLFKEGADIYKHFSSRLFDKPIDQVTKDERFLGKVAILGLGYGMGAFKFQLILAQGAMGPPLHISVEEAQRVVQVYRHSNRPIALLWAFFERMLELMIKGSTNYLPKEKGPLTIYPDKIVGPTGAYIQYTPDKLNDSFGGKIVENVVQFLCRLLLVNVNRNVYESLGLRSAFHVHDELIYCLPENQADQYIPEINRIMVTPPDWAKGFPMSVEGATHYRYTK